jgi:hypothetical protein
MKSGDRRYTAEGIAVEVLDVVGRNVYVALLCECDGEEIKRGLQCFDAADLYPEPPVSLVAAAMAAEEAKLAKLRQETFVAREALKSLQERIWKLQGQKVMLEWGK